jgi:hypothetical protein
VNGFNLPLVLKDSSVRIRIIPSEQWKSTQLAGSQTKLFTEDAVEKMYYVDAVYTKQ